MSGTHHAVMGDRGRLVVPAELRERHGLRAGSSIIFWETAEGIVFATRDEVARMIQEELKDRDLVGELLAERRAAAAAEDPT